MIDQSHALIAHLDIEHLIATGEVKWSLLHVDLDAGREGIAAVQAAQAYHKRPKFRTQTGAPIAVPGEARSERAPVEQPTTGAGTSPSPAPVVNPDTEGEPCESTQPHPQADESSPTTSSDETDTTTATEADSSATATKGHPSTSPTSPSPSSSTGASSARRDALLERWRALTPDQRAVYAGLTFDKTDLDAVEAAITTAATGEATEGEPCDTTSMSRCSTATQTESSSSTTKLAASIQTAEQSTSTPSPQTTSATSPTPSSLSATSTPGITSPDDGSSSGSPSNTGATTTPSRRDALRARYAQLADVDRGRFRELNVDPDDIDAVEAALDSIDPFAQEQPLTGMYRYDPERVANPAAVATLIAAIRASGHADTINRWMAGHGWSIVKPDPTVANYERCRVALALAEATGGSDAEVRVVLAMGFAGGEWDPALPVDSLIVGFAIGELTVDECARVHDIATAIGTTLAFIYDDAGNPVLVDAREVAA